LILKILIFFNSKLSSRKLGFNTLLTIGLIHVIAQ